ncbi:MAG: glycyl-radical enzyme activating protein [Melioribacteraceae bacterium]
MKSTTGILFELFRFSVNDGPGIRTTVFLKGCPLNCLWCHNPESIPFQPQLSFNNDACINCLKCVDACKSNTHLIEDNKHKVNFSNCILAGDCISVCDSKALSIIGENKSVQEIIEVVKQDKDYFKNSGGGLTISGGEPMSQFNFIYELLKEAKANGIETCLDTSGYAPQDKFEKILPLVDLFLYDYKATTESFHKKLVSVSSELILNNLEFLYSKGARIILRCPMIPGVNDNDVHFKAIAEIADKYPILEKLELMPYHKMGNEKGLRIGIKPEIDYLENTDERTKEKWIDNLKSFGCNKVVIG